MQKVSVTLQPDGCGSILFISLKAILHLTALLVLRAQNLLIWGEKTLKELNTHMHTFFFPLHCLPLKKKSFFFLNLEDLMVS